MQSKAVKESKVTLEENKVTLEESKVASPQKIKITPKDKTTMRFDNGPQITKVHHEKDTAIVSSFDSLKEMEIKQHNDKSLDLQKDKTK